MSGDTSDQSTTGTHTSGGVAVDRRNILQGIGAGALLTTVAAGSGNAHDASDSGIAGRVGEAARDATATQTQSSLSYTLTVTDASGDFEQSVSVEDETPLAEYGGHISFSTIGDRRFDNDSGIVDQVRLGTGEVVEDWEDVGENGGWEENYHRTNTGGGEFQVVGSPTSGGERALRLYSGCCGDAITSDDPVLSLDTGVTVRADIRHQTDNSGTYAHKTHLSVGNDTDGSGGIRVELINPGSQRTAGAKLSTPGAEARIEFEPELEEFYTFSVTIGGGSTATVSGTVQSGEDGTPLGGVSVIFTRSSDGTQFETETSESSGSVGEYSTSLPVDEEGQTDYEITVDPDGYQAFTETVTLSQGESVTNPIELTPVETGTITGQVSDQSGTPVSDVTLELVPDGADTPEQTATTDNSGTYEVVLPVGEYLIGIEKQGFESSDVPVLVPPNQTVQTDITLTQTDPSVAISSLSVGPDALLRGTDSNLAFVAAVEVDDGAAVEVSSVDVEYEDNGEEFPAVRIDSAASELLQSVLRSLDITLPTTLSTGALVALLEQLLGASGDQIYAAVVPSGPTPLLVGSNEFVVRATASDGSIASSQVTIPQYEPGDKLDSFETTANGPEVGFDRQLFLVDYEVEFGEDLMPDNLPLELGLSLFDADLNYTGRGSLDLNTLAATVASRGASGISVLGTAGVEFQTGGRWNGGPNGFTYNLYWHDVWLAALAQVPVPVPKKLRVNLPEDAPVLGGEQIGLELEVIPSGYMLSGYSDPDTPGIADPVPGGQDTGTAHGRTRPSQTAEFPTPVHSEFNLYFTVEATAGVAVVEAFVSGSIDHANDIGLEGAFVPPVGIPLEPVGGTVCLDGGVRIVGGPVELEVSIGTLAELTPGFTDPCVSLGENREPPCWDVFDIDGNCQEYPSPTSLIHPTGGYDISDSGVGLAATTGQNPPANALTAETETGVVTRLTDRPERDTSPAVAARANADEHLAVWERHPEDTPAEDGRTLVTAARDASGWSDPTTLADTTSAAASYHEPALATNAGTAAIAWTRYSLGESDAVRALDETTRIELVVEDGGTWSDPAVVAETADWVDRNPAIAPLGEGWVVAWERTQVDSETRAVGYAVLDATGAVQREETIPEAAQPGVGTDGGSVVLGYHDRATQQVRRDLITQNDRTTDHTHDLSEGASVRDLSIAGQHAAWLVTDVETTTGFYAEGGTVEELAFVSRESPLSRLHLVETSAGPVLTAARVPETDIRERSFIYRLRDDDGWRPEQVPVSADATADVKLWASAVAPTTDGDGLVAVLEPRVHDPDAVSDIAAVEQPLRPSYSITAEADQETVPPGAEMTVSYTIENTGDLDGDAIGADSVLVEARSQGQTLADQQESPLARGATATGELTFTVDETGAVDIVVGRELDLLDPEEQRITIEGSTPLLSVDSVAVERPDEGTAVGTIQIRNSGPVDAETFGIEVYAGDDTLLGETQVKGPAAGKRSSATIEFDPSDLVRTGGEQVHIDPDENLPESHVTQRVSPVLLGQPDITVDEGIVYSETDDGAVAMLELTNAGPVSTSVVIRAVQADATPEDGSFADEDLLGTAQLDIPAAIDESRETTTVPVTLEGVEYGDEVRYIVKSGRPVARAGIPVVSDRVGPFSGVAALPGYDKPPRDLDGDGRFEDVDGDGKFTIFDVQALFNGLDSDPVQTNPEAFSFSDDSADEVTIFDVQGLFTQLSEEG